MELNKRNIIFATIIIFAGILFVCFWNLYKYNKFYSSEVDGIVEDIKANRKFENSKAVKFVGEKDFNDTFWIYAPYKNDLRIDDSIYKTKNSEVYQIYRQDSSGKYTFYKTLKNQP